MVSIFDRFKVEIIKESIQRIQMTDEEYFGPKYKDYVSNSKLALLNPDQGGSPQRFFQGFKSSNSQALALGSAVHQLTLEKEIHELSELKKPSGKLGEFYKKFTDSLAYEKINLPKFSNSDEFIKYVVENKNVEKAALLAIIDADYYVNEVKNYKGDGIPSRLQSALNSIFTFMNSDKPDKIDNKNIIYLASDQYDKCVNCVESLKSHSEIQRLLNRGNSYNEDVILCEVKVSFPKDFKDYFLDEVEETIVKIKIKIDNWTVDNDILTLNDLKTTGRPVQYFMGYNKSEIGISGDVKEVFVPGSWDKFYYSRQMAMYLWLLKEYAKLEYSRDFKCYANMLVVETCKPFTSHSYPVSQESIKRGWSQFTELLKRAAFHQIKGYNCILEHEVEGKVEILDLSI